MTDIIYTSRNSLRLFNEEESIPAEYIYTSRNSLRLFNKVIDLKTCIIYTSRNSLRLFNLLKETQLLQKSTLVEIL